MDTVEKLLHKTLARDSRRLPESTYRLQFHAGFRFEEGIAITGYLDNLGVSHCYASPYLKARPGSTHGYDIVDHRVLNPEIGSEEDYEALVEALHEHGLGQILDVVPNHMGVATQDNPWWNDVLENGPISPYANFFDIAWRSSPRPELQDKVLLPVLGAPYGETLESGQFRLIFANGAFSIGYYDRRFPISPRSYEFILGHRLEELEGQFGADSLDLAEYQSILTAIKHLPNRTETNSAQIAELQREKEVIKRRLAELADRSQQIRHFIEANERIFQGTPGNAHSFDLLDTLLNNQCYRLSYWRVASDEINYRRFFDVNELAALSMEREEVFHATHQLVLRLLSEGKLDGLRIDHPDGLYDPHQYFRRLQHHYLLSRARYLFETDPEFQGQAWKEVEGPLATRIDAALASGEGPERWPLYVAAEKILAANEPLPQEWAIHGTSGYDFVNAVNGLFVDNTAKEAFTRGYRELLADYDSFAEVVYRSKQLIIEVSLASELHMLAYQLDRLAQKSRRSRDFTLNSLRDALREVIACFPVYRSYISEEGVHDTDRKYVEMAVRRASKRNPLVSRSLFRFIGGMLLLRYPEGASAEDQAEQRRFAGKFQQVTSPVMAKGVEDTAFYIYNRLVSLNEVGGDPDRFGVTAESLHRFNQDRQAKWPYSLSPLSTHDTKRSEDVRARLNVLSEMPDDWFASVKRWFRLNEPHHLQVDEAAVPDPNEEYLLYQTLIGAWPLNLSSAEERADFVARVQAYLVKALHEAKVHTSWVNPNADYDKAIQEFISRILDPETGRAFLEDFQPFQARVSHFGLLNSLGQTLLKITSPGVPDTYQGSECWDFSLVDPDNRRPVDYKQRRQMLAGLQLATGEGKDLRGLARELIASKEDSRVKLYLNMQALHARREHPGLFSTGEYLPLKPTGAQADHIFAFARRSGNTSALVVVPRLLTRLVGEGGLPLGEQVWQNTRIPLPALAPGLRWKNVLTGAILSATEEEGTLGLRTAEILADFPVALLLAEME